MVNAIHIYNEILRWLKDNEMINAIYIYNDLLRWFKDNEMGKCHLYL